MTLRGRVGYPVMGGSTGGSMRPTAVVTEKRAKTRFWRRLAGAPCSCFLVDPSMTEAGTLYGVIGAGAVVIGVAGVAGHYWRAKHKRENGKHGLEVVEQQDYVVDLTASSKAAPHGRGPRHSDNRGRSVDLESHRAVEVELVCFHVSQTPLHCSTLCSCRTLLLCCGPCMLLTAEYQPPSNEWCDCNAAVP